MRPSDAARAAFAIGWARATARYPVAMTERAGVACTAAMRVAEASPQPDLTPTINLGQLEGIWAVVYARREALEKLHAGALADVMKAIKALDWAQVIDDIERQMHVDPGLTAEQLQAKLGQTVESLISSQLDPADAGAWRNAMQAALLDSQAEGSVAGLSLVGDAAGVTINWDLAATDAKAALAGNQALWDQSSDWVAQQTHGLGSQVSQKLASLWDAGASRTEMEDAISDILGATRNNAGILLDTAIGQSISVGALATYDQAGVQFVNFDTAGDGRVCPACDEAEDDNSYALSAFPAPPLHVGCRCAASPADYVPTQAALTMLAPYADDAGDEDEGFESWWRAAIAESAGDTVHDGVAILLMLTAVDAADLAIADGEPAENLHVTLGYLAQDAADYTAAAKTTLIASLTGLLEVPIMAAAFATAQFNPNDPEREPCAVVLVQSTELAELHDAVTEAIGDEASTTFPIWFPHVAISYGTDTTVIPTARLGTDLTFDRLVLGWAGEQIDITDKTEVAA